MTTAPVTSSVPVGAALVGGLAAQLVDDAAYLLLPPTAVLAPFSGLLAVLLTAGAARIVTRGRSGPVVARTGLAVGAVSAATGLVVGGLGFATVFFAVLVLVAGVAGAVAGRRGTTAD